MNGQCHELTLINITTAEEGRKKKARSKKPPGYLPDFHVAAPFERHAKKGALHNSREQKRQRTHANRHTRLSMKGSSSHSSSKYSPPPPPTWRKKKFALPRGEPAKLIELIHFHLPQDKYFVPNWLFILARDLSMAR